MPLNGSDVASRVSGAAAVANTVAESAKYNSEFDDVYAILNSVRSIAKGYTGASTAVGAFDNIVTKGVDVASASTLNLDTATGALVNVTGTTTVTAVTLGTGKSRIVRATGAFQITAGASLIVNGSTSVNYTTTAGDLLFFEGYSSSVVRVWVIGTQNARPAFKVHKNGTGQTIAFTSYAKLTWATQVFDTHGYFDIATNHRFTPLVAGKYQFNLTLEISGIAASKTIVAAIYKNGANVAQQAFYTGTGSSGSVNVAVSTIEDANGSTDYFEAYVYNGDAGPRDVIGSSVSTHFSGARIA